MDSSKWPDDRKARWVLAITLWTLAAGVFVGLLISVFAR